MKKPGVLLVLSLMCLLSGCGKSGTTEKDSIEIKKGGTIVETVRESFEEEYYDIEELKTYISSAIDTYNADFAEARIELERCSVKGTIAEAVMTYDSMNDYVEFNHMDIFVGDISELAETSYYDDVNLVDREGEKVSLSHISSSGESYQVLVVTQECDVKVNGKIAYVSEEVEILSRKNADVTVSDEACAYIIYK